MRYMDRSHAGRVLAELQTQYGEKPFYLYEALTTAESTETK
jgi:hypothetical protein